MAKDQARKKPKKRKGGPVVTFRVRNKDQKAELRRRARAWWLSLPADLRRDKKNSVGEFIRERCGLAPVDDANEPTKEGTPA